MKKWLISFLLFFLFIPNVLAKEVTLYLFHQEGCPHCAAEREFLSSIEEEYTDVSFVFYEVSKDDKNKQLLTNVKKTLKDYNNYVPYTVIGPYSLSGFNTSTKSSIRTHIEYCLENDCKDIVAEVEKKGMIDLEKEKQTQSLEETTYDIPILGVVEAKKVSLPLLSIVIGFLDGFNPCAMWILLFLISMLLGLEDRKRMWSLGIAFLFTSAFVYLLFMVSWLKITLELQSVFALRFMIGLVALTAGIINLRSYMKMRKDPVGCHVTDASKRKKMIEKIRKFTSEKSFLLALIGVVTLAVSVNFIELACSAGLPVIFTQILALNTLSIFEYSLYIGIYIFFYLLDDLVVFMIAMITLKVTGITNKYNKYSHLIGGILMLTIGLLLILKPEILMFSF